MFIAVEDETELVLLPLRVADKTDEASVMLETDTLAEEVVEVVVETILAVLEDVLTVLVLLLVVVVLVVIVVVSAGHSSVFI